MRVLVVGVAGQVGGAVARVAAASGHTVVGTYLSRAPPWSPERLARLDKSDPSTLEPALSALAPEVVVDTGALHHVDYCEAHPEEARRVNAEGTAALARACAARSVPMVFVSTDYVFDGTGRPPYREEDEAHPAGAYGASKREGEEGTLRASAAHLVVRPSVIFSWIPPAARLETGSRKGVNFATWALDELSAGRPLRIVHDQIGSPTLAEDLAGAILSLVEQRRSGLYHTAGATAINRYEFTVRLARRAGFDPGSVRPIATSELRQAARRPPDSSLDSSRLLRDTGYRTLDVDRALERLVDAWRADQPSGRPAEAASRSTT